MRASFFKNELTRAAAPRCAARAQTALTNRNIKETKDMVKKEKWEAIS
jgi:hypothetical protein